MPNVLLISNDEDLKNALSNFNLRVNFPYEENFEDFEADSIVVDSSIEDSKLILMKIIGKNLSHEFDIFYLTDTFIENKDVKILTKPVNYDILGHEINLSFENKKRFKELQFENLDLKKSLYQIDTFYGASSKFAGTLDKEKLYEVMFETFERILSFDMACALIKDNFEEDNLKFYINSLKKTTDETNSNIIKRLYLAAKNEGMDELKPKKQVDIIQKTKPSYKNEFFDLTTNDFDTLYAPVVIQDKFEGVIEIFRKNPFSKEDVTCFQSIIHQVLAPLRSAILYEEIKNANVKLKKLERIKSEFVSIVSHELRTPLTPINNALSIILSEQGGKIGDVNKNFCNIAKRNVSRLSGIIEDLLDLSRMQTGKFDFQFKKTGIYPSLELAYNTFKNQAAEKNITLTLEKEENMPDVYIDPHRIDQILSNLITNAIKFTNENGRIEINAKITETVDEKALVFPAAKDYSGKYIEISVKDTGVGLEGEDIPKIFDKFSQIENTLSRNTGGIGLGLTITKHFIDAHLGGIRVEAKKNEGANFIVTIPVYSENKAFETELNLKIKNENKTGYLKLEEKNDSKFYEYLKNSNIIKLTKNSKELSYNADDKCITKVIIPNLEKTAFDFMVSKIEEEINSKDETCDIVLTKAYYKKEA